MALTTLIGEYAVLIPTGNAAANFTSAQYRIPPGAYALIQITQPEGAVGITIEGSINGTTWTAVGAAITTAGFTQLPRGHRGVRAKRDGTTNPSGIVLLSVTPAER